MGREKLVLVEHVAKHAREPNAIDESKQPSSFPLSGVLPDHVILQFTAIVQKPHHPAVKTGQTRHQLGLESLDGQEWDETDERAHLERAYGSIGQMEHVVEESVVAVPELDPLPGDVIHGVRDVDEMLEEL